MNDPDMVYSCLIRALFMLFPYSNSALISLAF